LNFEDALIATFFKEPSFVFLSSSSIPSHDLFLHNTNYSQNFEQEDKIEKKIHKLNIIL